ncbi:MAG: formate dehydrogenase accessory sulfurtransferase FdhD [Candidatus Thorarchaeota archaeon]
MCLVTTRKITRLLPGGPAPVTERLAVEVTLRIVLDSEEVALLRCSPGHERELALGHLICQGYLRPDISAVRFELDGNTCRVSSTTDNRQSSQTTSATPPSHTSRSLGSLLSWLDRMVAKQVTLRQTGGTHSALVFSLDGARYAFAEDIGRHNAVDKAVGSAVLQGIDLRSSGLLVSSRISEVTASKCTNAGIPLLASIAVATDAAVDRALREGLTMIGSLSETGPWLYSEGKIRIVV